MTLVSFAHPTISKIGDKHWFHEINDSFPGQSFGLEVVRILHHSQSAFQDILVFESATFGNVLVLNGIVQCTEKDEFAYQELITHVPVMCHEKPAKVLVIGGGDCGVVRELVKHLEDGVEEIVMVEIDRAVIDLSIKYLPNMAKFHNHPKVKIVIEDGFKFLERLSSLEDSGKYDVIITDSSDPEGPAQEFFDTGYYGLLKNALKPDGIVAMQSSENIWLNLPYLCDLLNKTSQVFSNVEYCQCYMPSYTSGQLGLVIASPAKSRDLKNPVKNFDDRKDLFKYYNSKVHEASFVLPTWAANALEKRTT
ncbi:hypothetical protein PUMCH_004064 [Australozyma saopauloensis]|uniref:PABS domain-containing protein n=1 Tax=Australozyma saopauloensis TaxID=291208 RepID=A0AAX4HEB8_9ASCO|nr:hypothetical protein PUMCH_004064 [[Candida] saopauloensis]